MTQMWQDFGALAVTAAIVLSIGNIVDFPTAVIILAIAVALSGGSTIRQNRRV